MTSLKVISRATKRLLYRSTTISVPANTHSIWTSDNTVTSPFRDVEIPNTLIPEQIWQNLDKWADKPALVCGVTNKSFTYHQTYKYSRNFAAALRSKLGIRDRDVVCIVMPNLPEYGILVLGILQAGAEVTTVNPIYTAHEVSRQLLLSNPKVIIGTPDTTVTLKEALKLSKKNIPIITVKNASDSLPIETISFGELAFDNNTDHSVLKEVNKKFNDIAFLPYSSGTTGLPKGVELSNGNIVSNLVQMSCDEIKHYADTTTTAGYAISNTELKVVDSDMRNLGPNEVGELFIRGPQIMKGYRNNPEATKAAITADGWFKSGDMAKLDEKGAVTIVDRLKELIKVKGYQVPPAELESVLKEHPSVLDAAVVGIADDKQGEAPKAFIVVRDGHKLQTDDVTKFVEERVAPYKRIKQVMFMESIPKNPSGKILRKVLKEKYC